MPILSSTSPLTTGFTPRLAESKVLIIRPWDVQKEALPMGEASGFGASPPATPEQKPITARVRVAQKAECSSPRPSYDTAQQALCAQRAASFGFQPWLLGSLLPCSLLPSFTLQ